jgi:hypothetical protein
MFGADASFVWSFVSAENQCYTGNLTLLHILSARLIDVILFGRGEVAGARAATSQLFFDVITWYLF